MTMTFATLVTALALGFGVYLLIKLVLGIGWLLGRALAAAGWVLRRVLGLARATLGDAVQGAGALLTAALVLPLALANAAVLRFRSARHYAAAAGDEVRSALVAAYRVAVGNPLRFLGLGALLEGVEKRLPATIDRAPGAARTAEPRHAPRFDGYRVEGELPPGGSGARLYLARPTAAKRAELAARGRDVPDEVVVKSFALGTGASLDEIVREGRALDAASRLGLVLEHALGERSFHYVMPYVPGEDLEVAATRLHERAPAEGLDDRQLATALGWMRDLLTQLERFHAAGLWHKDIKPQNLIVSGGRLQVVDLGLVTPLASALTLTTHGTEYYRDPEVVRLAMQGVKVREVDGVKFDLYSAGAVLYRLVEGSFPAHGSLSRISKRCPEALAWIVRRAMAELGSRYGSAAEMRADVEALIAARDPFALWPIDLPSLHGTSDAAAAARAGVVLAGPTPDAGGAAAAAHVRAPARRPCRRRRRAALAAAAVFAAVAFARARAEDRAVHAERVESVVVTPYPEVEGVRAAIEGLASLVEERRPGGDVAARHATAAAHAAAAERVGAAGRAEDVHAGLVRKWRTALARSLPRARAGDEPRTVLVLEWPHALPGREAADALAVALEREGCTVLGLRALRAGGSADGAAEEELVAHAGETDGFALASGKSGELDLVAAACHAVGLSDPTDDRALFRLESWLADAAEVDAVVWLAPGPEEGQILYRVALRPDLRVEEPETLVVGR